MIQAQVDRIEKTFSQSNQHYERIKEELSSRTSQTMSHSAIETMLETEGRKLLRALFEDHVALRSTEERDAPALRVVDADGATRHWQRQRERHLESIFGTVGIARMGYRSAGLASLFPLDGSLNLPVDQFSLGVRRRVAVEAARGSFDEAVTAIAANTGAQVAKRQAEELARRAAADFDGFYGLRRPMNVDELAAQSALLVMSLDGKGIVVRLEDLRPATKKAAKENAGHKMQKRLSPGEKKYRKRMAMVAAVYTVEPHFRTAEQIVYRSPSDEKAPRPRPENKRVWASIEKDPEQVVRDMFAEALRRDPEKVRTWVALSDGNETQLALLEQLASEHGVKLTIIVDIIHVLEYLWDATTAFNARSTPEAEEWVTERLLAVLRGKSSDVAGGMRRSATLRHLEAKDRAAVDDCANYLIKYGDLLRYDKYLEQGLPIATGVIEGACRHLIKDRMDITGARWGLAGAEAVLRLRSLRSSGDFDEYWSFHERQEHARNHASNYQNHVVPESAAIRRARMRAAP